MRVEGMILVGQRSIIPVGRRAGQVDDEIDTCSFARAEALSAGNADRIGTGIHRPAVGVIFHRRDQYVRTIVVARLHKADPRSEEHTSELQSLMRISYAVFCLK